MSKMKETTSKGTMFKAIIAIVAIIIMYFLATYSGSGSSKVYSADSQITGNYVIERTFDKCMNLMETAGYTVTYGETRSIAYCECMKVPKDPFQCKHLIIDDDEFYPV